MRIALVVDHPLRDLPSLVLLACRLCQHGVTCHLVPLNLMGEIWMLAPDFVLLNYLNVANQKLVRQLLDSGIKVGVLDTEGAARLEIAAKILAPDPELRFGISFYCCWGTKLREHAKREGWYREEQLIVTGSPRFDFYVHPWRDAALQASNYAESYARPFVLIMGNFPLSNPLFKSPEQEANWLIESLGFNRDYVMNWQRIQSHTKTALVDLCKSSASHFRQVNFVYRPHPFEDSETYRGLEDGLANLHFVKKGPVYGWLLRASAVIQRSCFTAVEAVMAGIPALSPAWIPTPANLVIAEDVSIACETEDDLLQVLESVLAGDFKQPEYIQHRLEGVIEEWFYRTDGRAHERVADCIMSSLPDDGGSIRYGSAERWPTAEARLR